MQQIFFSIKKKYYFLFFLLSYFPIFSTYSERLLSTSFYSENQKTHTKNVYNVYGHHKFCKRINFYYQAEIKKIDNKQKLILNLLLMDHEEHEQEIIPNNETLLNQLQWHCHLIYNEDNILAETIIKKEKNQNDIILFGKNHISFGTLYTISFNLEDCQERELVFNINQYDREFIICLNL
jgi:hypothetical protein